MYEIHLGCKNLKQIYSQLGVHDDLHIHEIEHVTLHLQSGLSGLRF